MCTFLFTILTEMQIIETFLSGNIFLFRQKSYYFVSRPVNINFLATGTTLLGGLSNIYAIQLFFSLKLKQYINLPSMSSNIRADALSPESPSLALNGLSFKIK
jgi:hypothetical protein